MKHLLLTTIAAVSVGSSAAIGQNVSQRAAVALAALVLALLSSPYEVQGQTDRPNVLILFADDLGHGDVSYNGGDIPTPNIDALVADGVRFASGYMTAPLCNPSRAGLITGRYQPTLGTGIEHTGQAAQRVGRKGLATPPSNRRSARS